MQSWCCDRIILHTGGAFTAVIATGRTFCQRACAHRCFSAVGEERKWRFLYAGSVRGRRLRGPLRHRVPPGCAACLGPGAGLPSCAAPAPRGSSAEPPAGQLGIAGPFGLGHGLGRHRHRHWQSSPSRAFNCPILSSSRTARLRTACHVWRGSRAPRRQAAHDPPGPSPRAGTSRRA